jgi:curved DNA-binding protein CbpA
VLNKKKTMYEILEVSPNATYTEIQAAYQKITQKFQSKEHGLSHEEVGIKLKVIGLAFDTLSVPTSRGAYDAKLAMANAPIQHIVPLKLEVAIEETRKSPLRMILTVIAGLMAAGMVMQLAFMSLAYRHTAAAMDGAEHVNGEVSKAEEKVILQEYYQEHGVRAGSKIEADLLDVERRSKENEARAKTNELQEQDRKYKQFVEESKRVGDQVSYDLHRAEEQARVEAERKQQQLAEEKRKQEDAERMHIESEKNKWRLQPSSNSYDSSYNE